MDISSLQAFIAVARNKSFSKASEHLFITQPAISKRVASLEEELGIQLFSRVARQISLTEAGKQLLPKAQELVDQAENMQRYASNLSDEISGNLSIAIAHHVGLHRMPPILREFNLRFSNVNLDIRFEDSEQACASVEQGDIEFAVITLPQKPPKNLIKHAIWQDPLSIVVSVDHALAQINKVTFSDLAQFPSVIPSQETETHKIIRREFEQRQLSLNVQMQTNNLETLKMLAVAGLGWSLLPQTMLKQQDHSTEFCVLNLDVALSRELGLVIHRRRSLSNAALALKSLIEN